jgi:hypothetical protein
MQHNPEPLVVKPKIAWQMLGCSNTRGYELLAAGELQSFKDGRSRKITVDSIRRYVERRLAASKPTKTLLLPPTHDLPPMKGRRGRPRKTTQLELPQSPFSEVQNSIAGRTPLQVNRPPEDM